MTTFVSFRTEYWKSQGKKWCEYCKCWISDNKAVRPSKKIKTRNVL